MRCASNSAQRSCVELHDRECFSQPVQPFLGPTQLAIDFCKGQQEERQAHSGAERVQYRYSLEQQRDAFLLTGNAQTPALDEPCEAFIDREAMFAGNAKRVLDGGARRGCSVGPLDHPVRVPGVAGGEDHREGRKSSCFHKRHIASSSRLVQKPETGERPRNVAQNGHKSMARGQLVRAKLRIPHREELLEVGSRFDELAEQHADDSAGRQAEAPPNLARLDIAQLAYLLGVVLRQLELPSGAAEGELADQHRPQLRRPPHIRRRASLRFRTPR